MSSGLSNYSKNVAQIFSKFAQSYEDQYLNVDNYTAHLDEFVNCISQENAAILDIGCGPANLSKYIQDQRENWKISGIDLSPQMIALAKLNVPMGHFSVLAWSKLNEYKGRFDGVLAGFCLPYLPIDEAEIFIRNISKLIKKNGILYLSTTLGNYADSKYVHSSENKELKLFTYYYSIPEIENLLNSNGLKVLSNLKLPNVLNGVKGDQEMVIIACKS